MRIRRALAAAAATAAIVPAALMAAPAAYADETGSTGTSQTEQTADPTQPAGDTEQSDGESSDPAQESSDPAADPTGEADPAEEQGQDENGTDDTTDEQADDEEQSGSEEDQSGTEDGTDDSATDENTDPSGDASDPATEPSDDVTDPATEPSDEATDPADEEPVCTEADFTTSLSGFPNKIVAGSGWHEFRLNLNNSKGEDVENVLLGMSVLYKKDLASDYSSLNSKFATLEYFDPVAKNWTDAYSKGGDIQGTINVPAGQSVSLQLRVRVSADAPAGAALALAFGVYGSVDSDDCQLATKWYQFDVVAAGDKPGDVVDVKPQGGAVPIDVKPQGDTKPMAQLAETGSSSNLTAIGLTGAAAVALGAGAVVVMRRRKAGDAA